MFSLLRNGQFFTRNFMVNTNIQIMLIKSSSVLHTVSSDRSLFMLLNKWINSDIWALKTNYLASSLPCKVKTLALYGLISTVLDYGFIWFNFYLDLIPLHGKLTNEFTPQIFSNRISWVFHLEKLKINLFPDWKAFMIMLPCIHQAQQTNTCTRSTINN